MSANLPRRARAALLSALLHLLGVGPSQAGDALDQWHWRHPLPQGNALANVVWVNNQYVALGELGTLLTSSNGTNWTAQQSTTLDQLRDCAYGNGTYVTVGDYGTILSSANGIDWTPQFGGTFYSLNAVAFANNRFVAVGAGGNILTSEDGQDWTLRAVGPWIYYDVIYAENMFVAGGQSNIVTSADGIIWTRRSWAASTFRSIAHGDGKFMAIARGQGLSEVWSSDDGFIWQFKAEIGTYPPLRTIIRGAEAWLVATGLDYDRTIGFTSSGPGTVFASVDTVNWELVFSNPHAMNGIALGDGKFVSACINGAILCSNNGTNWADVAGAIPARSPELYDLVYVNGSFVGLGGLDAVFSTNGQDWTALTVATNPPHGSSSLQCVAYGNGRYVIGGQYNWILTSTDGRSWTNLAPELLDLGDAHGVSALAFGNGLFVGIGGSSHYVFTSPDGLVWSARQVLGTDISASFNWYALAFGDGLFVAVDGDSGYVATSSDGTNWTLQQTGGYPHAYFVTYGNGRFVAFGYNTAFVSTDGMNWTRVNLPNLGYVGDVAYGGGRFVAVGYDSYYQRYSGEASIWVSRDGFNWTRRASRTHRRLTNVAYGNGTFVASSDDGAILQSDPFLNLSFDLISGPRLTVTGPNDRWCTIESTDVLDPSREWQPETDVLMEGGTATLAAPSFSNAANRFYRARLRP